MKDEILELFQKYDFYDFVVSKMNFDFNLKTIEIEFQVCDDIIDKYTPMNLKFIGVTKFLSNYNENFNFSVSGCYSAKCKQISKNKYKVSFIFQLRENGRDVPAWEVEINFGKMETKGGLSKEALKYKYEYA